MKEAKQISVLDEIASVRMGKTILSKELTETGVPVYSAGRDSGPWGFVPESDLKFGSETIVISARGNIGIPRAPREEKFVSTQTTIAISLYDPNLRPFVTHYLELVDWRSMTSQTTIPMITVKQVRAINIPLPPLPEQRRIVARIEELFSRLDAGVAALRHAKAQLQRYRQSVLAAAVTGQLTQAWREQHPDSEPAKEVLERILAVRRVQWEGKGKYKEPNSPNPVKPISLPMGWCLASPEHISTHIVDCPHSTPKWTPTGEICLRTTNFLPGRMILDEVRYVSPTTYSERISRLEPQPGDVLYSREGGILGLACIIPNGLKACLGQRMMQFRIDADIAIPEYFNFVLNSPMILSEVKRMTGGSASPHLNIGDIRAFPIPLPPLAEQHQIVAEVEARTTAIDHLEAELDRQITRSNRLRQSVLASAFSGVL